MDITELRIEYKRSTGKNPVEGKDSSITGDLYFRDKDDIKEYLEWLESEYLQIRNILGINERALNIMKKMK